MQPTTIRVLESKFLWIKWLDETESKIGLQKLRELCPCATYIPLIQKNQVTLDELEVVGNYAIKIKWHDGHNTGIYEYTFLKKLAG
jgi:DUF971 family protein